MFLSVYHRMAYTVKVEICQTNTDFFRVVEQTVFHYANGGIWEGLTLTMNGSGTSGGLRLKSSGGDYAFVIFGIHNYAPWCDVAVDLASGNTGVEVHPTYYAGGARSHLALVPRINKTDGKGRGFTVQMRQEEGNTYVASIDIS